MTLQKAILATLTYHDIFDYPLTLEEIYQYLIKGKATSTSLNNGIGQLVKTRKIGNLDDYYFLRGRKKIVTIRIKRQKYSETKFKRALFFSKILKAVPTLKMVAVSGALALENSHKDDDIDLVLISAKRTIWTTRFIANILLLAFKRDPKGKKVSNRACLNLFIDQSNLKIKPQNLYLAHEICQMKPLWDRDNTYQKFLKANAWVKNFLPNWQPSSQFTAHSSQKSKLSIVNCQLSIVETLLKKFQLWYMRPKITTERIGKTQLFFHPAGTQKWVIEEYQKMLKKLNLTM